MEWKEIQKDKYVNVWVSEPYKLIHYHGIEDWTLYHKTKELSVFNYNLTPAEAQAEAEKFIRQRELEKRVGTRVKEGDTFPAGTELYSHRHRNHYRIVWENGYYRFWNIECRWWFGEEHKLPASDPMNIEMIENEIPDESEITKIGPGVSPGEEEGKMSEKMTLDVEKLYERARETAKTCPTAAEAIKGLLPEAFREKYEPLSVWIGKSNPVPYVCLRFQGQPILASLGHSQVEPESEIERVFKRPMTSGTILLTVKNGKIASAKVNED